MLKRFGKSYRPFNMPILSSNQYMPVSSMRISRDLCSSFWNVASSSCGIDIYVFCFVLKYVLAGGPRPWRGFDSSFLKKKKKRS